MRVGEVYTVFRHLCRVKLSTLWGKVPKDARVPTSVVQHSPVDLVNVGVPFGWFA